MKPPKAPDRLNKSKQRRYLFEETNQKRIKEGGRADLLRQVPLYGILVCHYARMLRFTCIRCIGHTDHLGKGNRDHEGRLQSNSSDLHNRRCRNRRRSTAFDELLTKRKNGRRVKSLAQENHHHLGDLKQPSLYVRAILYGRLRQQNHIQSDFTRDPVQGKTVPAEHGVRHSAKREVFRYVLQGRRSDRQPVSPNRPTTAIRCRSQNS